MKLYSRRNGFTLVELLVVIGIIALLIGILMPALSRARKQAQATACMSNMRQVGQQMMMYSQNFKGWLFPPGGGSDSPVSERWPVYVFSPARHDPPELVCPTDVAPAEAHSYVLNNWLYDRKIKYSTRVRALSPSHVVVMGEKKEKDSDYYMNGLPGVAEYDRLIDPTKHEKAYGSNYLRLDMSVSHEAPVLQVGATDPWEVWAQ